MFKAFIGFFCLRYWFSSAAVASVLQVLEFSWDCDFIFRETRAIGSQMESFLTEETMKDVPLNFGLAGVSTFSHFLGPFLFTLRCDYIESCKL